MSFVLDASSTCYELAKLISQSDLRITVLTNGDLGFLFNILLFSNVIIFIDFQGFVFFRTSGTTMCSDQHVVIMYTNQRREKILALLQERGSVSVNDLTELLSVSKATIRSDLNYLSDNSGNAFLAISAFFSIFFCFRMS
jgi:biotin operon repressor